MVICLERGADLHMAQWMPLPLTVSCISKIQTGFTFLVPAHLGNPGKRAIKHVCVYASQLKRVCVCCVKTSAADHAPRALVCLPIASRTNDVGIRRPRRLSPDSVHRVLRHFNTAVIINAALLCKAQDVDYCYRYVR